MDFPSVTDVEMTVAPGDRREIQNGSYTYSPMMSRLFTFPRLKFLLLPAGHQDMIWRKFEDGSGGVSAASFKRKGVKVEYKDPSDFWWCNFEWALFCAG